MLLGTLRLQGTAQQVTADKPGLSAVWQAFKALSSSESSTPEETNAVLDQILGALTCAGEDHRSAEADQCGPDRLVRRAGDRRPVHSAAGRYPIRYAGRGQEQWSDSRTARGHAGSSRGCGNHRAGRRGKRERRRTILMDKVIETLEQLVGK